MSPMGLRMNQHWCCCCCCCSFSSSSSSPFLNHPTSTSHAPKLVFNLTTPPVIFSSPLSLLIVAFKIKDLRTGSLLWPACRGTPEQPSLLDAELLLVQTVVSDVCSLDRMQLVAPLRTSSPSPPSCLLLDSSNKPGAAKNLRTSSDSPCRLKPCRSEACSCQK